MEPIVPLVSLVWIWHPSIQGDRSMPSKEEGTSDHQFSCNQASTSSLFTPIEVQSEIETYPPLSVEGRCYSQTNIQCPTCQTPLICCWPTAKWTYQQQAGRHHTSQGTNTDWLWCSEKCLAPWYCSPLAWFTHPLHQHHILRGHLWEQPKRPSTFHNPLKPEKHDNPNKHNGTQRGRRWQTYAWWQQLLETNSRYAWWKFLGV